MKNKGRALRGPRMAVGIVCLLLGVCVLFPSIAHAYDGSVYTWVWQNPSTTDRQITSVAAASTNVAYAVGNYGLIYRCNSGTLTRQKSPTTSNLYAVDTVPGSTAIAYAVGQGGTIIRTTDSGSTWTVMPTPTKYDLTGVAVVSSTVAYAVGGFDGFREAVILRYNGTAWSVQEMYKTGGLNDVFAIDSTHVWAVGQDGSKGRTLFYDGTRWTERDTNAALISVSAYYASPNYNVWGVCWDGTVVRSANGGVSYVEETSLTKDWPASVTAVNSSNVWVVGWDGTIQYYNGNRWRQQNSGTTTDIYDVDASGAGAQFAVGYSNFLTSGGSQNWSRLTSSVTTANLSACVSYGFNDVWAAGAGGTVVHSVNGGDMWETQSSGVTWEIRSVDAASTSVAYLVGNNRTPRKTTNGGATWSATSAPVNTNWHGLAVANANTVWICGAAGNLSRTTNGGGAWTSQTSGLGNRILRSIDCVDTNNAMVVADGGFIATTTNGGTTWTPRTSNTRNNLLAVSMVSNDIAWAVGAQGTICYTTNGGVTWQVETSPVSQRINGVAAIDKSHAWAVAQNGQILYRDGSAWRLHTRPVTSAMTGVFAWDAKNAWAVGNSGNILFADPPYIKSCLPDHAGPGETVDVEVIGGYTHFLDGVPVLDFGSGVSMVPGSLNVVDNTTLFASIEVDPGAAPGPRDVNVVTGSEVPVPLAGGFTVGNEPRITSSSPSERPRGWTGDVRVTGCQTGFTGASRATFGSGIKVNSTTYVNSGLVTANVTVSPSAAPGPRTVNVKTGVENPVALEGGFTVATPPFISAVNPAEAAGGDVVTLSGARFGHTRYPGGGEPASEVLLDGKPVEVLSWADHSVSFKVPGGTRGGSVVVATADGASNAKELKVLESRVYYLAEGSTAWGFTTEIAIANPNERPVDVRVTYLTGDGPVRRPDFTMAPASRVTLNPADEGGLFPCDFSTKVECLTPDRDLAVERTMSWKADGAAAPGGHSSTGVSSPSPRWYLPEGSTAWGFECWMLVMNPSAKPARCKVTYMLETGGTKVADVVVAPNSRASLDASAAVRGADFSIMVESDTAVIAERAMYRNARREGHCSVGAADAATEYFLAEGSTAWGFTTYALIQNPNPEPAEVRLTCMTPDGPSVREPFTVPANGRRTVRLNDEVGETDVSTRVAATVPIVAERSMYWPAPAGEACHDSIGVAAAGSGAWYLADGRAGVLDGRSCETWTLVQNPNGRSAAIEVTYLSAEAGKNKSFTDVIPAGARRTYNMADEIGRGYAGVVVRPSPGSPGVIVEGSMYWGGRNAGTCSSGQYATGD